jgi:hypothetical protein
VTRRGLRFEVYTVGVSGINLGKRGRLANLERIRVLRFWRVWLTDPQAPHSKFPCLFGINRASPEAELLMAAKVGQLFASSHV